MTLSLLIFIINFTESCKKTNQFKDSGEKCDEFIHFKKRHISHEEFFDALKNCPVFEQVEFEFRNDEIAIETQKVYNARFLNTNTKDFNFLRDTITKLNFENCSIDGLEFFNCRIDSLSIINCKIRYLTFYENSANDVIINTGEDTLDRLIIQNPRNSKSIKLIGNFREILIEGGEISKLDITKIKNDDCAIQIVSTVLTNANLYSFESYNPYVFLDADISNAYFNNDDRSILEEEIQVDKINSTKSYETRRQQIKRRYSFLVTAYNHLSKVFLNQKKYSLSDYFEFRAKVCERKALDDRVIKAWRWFFHEKLRGNYGTSVWQIMKTFVFFGLFFSFVYFALGCFKLAFSYGIPLNNSGDDNLEIRPSVIHLKRNWSNVIPFYINCLFFSFNQMLLGGITKDFVRDILRFLIHPPKRYLAIGLGKIFGLIQYLLGILLLFFFISCFLRLSR